MSGHSKWSTIKHKKGAADVKRGKIFTKLGRAITIAAREGGGDMEANFALRLAVDKARQANMPSDNIDRAIKRGTGEGDDGIVMEKAVYGGYGPGGVAVAVDTLTDNTNRTVSELRKLFDEHGGNLADASSVLWQFHEKGRIVIKCAKVKKAEKFGADDIEVPEEVETVMMEVIDIAGVEDVKEIELEDRGSVNRPKYLEVITAAKQLAAVRSGIESLGYVVESVELAKLPENMQEVDDADAEKIVSLLQAVDDHDDVENVWVNADV